MKHLLFILVLMCSAAAAAASYYAAYPYADAAGQSGSTAIYMTNDAFVSWADGYTNLVPGANVTSCNDPVDALGEAEGTSYDVYCFGDGGEATFTFSSGIRDGDGYDFAVFENSFNDTFLELAFVEVSSDGANFVRFPNYSLISPDDQPDAEKIFGLAGKYRQGYGTPFDLSEITLAYEAALAGCTDFTNSFTEQLTNNYPLLDFDHISHIRLVDAITDNEAYVDSRGLTVNDSDSNSSTTAGFDLDAVGVINRSYVDGEEQVITFADIPHQQLDFGSTALSASSSSGLAVSFSVQSGPAAVTNETLYFTGTGTVAVAADQAGDETYAPASTVLQSFVIAERIQYIFVEPVPYLEAGSGEYEVNAYSSSGLPVLMEVSSGPDDVTISETNHFLNPAEAGEVVLRAYQSGDASTAPAEDVYVSVTLQESSDNLIAFDDWFETNAAPDAAFTTGTDQWDRAALQLTYEQDLRVQMDTRLLVSDDLVSWTNAVPEILELSSTGTVLSVEVQVPMTESNQYFRVEYEAR